MLFFMCEFISSSAVAFHSAGSLQDMACLNDFVSLCISTYAFMAEEWFPSCLLLLMFSFMSQIFLGMRPLADFLVGSGRVVAFILDSFCFSGITTLDIDNFSVSFELVSV